MARPARSAGSKRTRSSARRWTLYFRLRSCAQPDWASCWMRSGVDWANAWSCCTSMGTSVPTSRPMRPSSNSATMATARPQVAAAPAASRRRRAVAAATLARLRPLHRRGAAPRPHHPRLLRLHARPARHLPRPPPAAAPVAHRPRGAPPHAGLAPARLRRRRAVAAVGGGRCARARPASRLHGQRQDGQRQHGQRQRQAHPGRLGAHLASLAAKTHSSIKIQN